MKVIRLTEGDLHRIVRKTVSKIIREGSKEELDAREAYNKFADMRKDPSKIFDQDLGDELWNDWKEKNNRAFGKPNPEDSDATKRRNKEMQKTFKMRDVEQGWTGEESQEYDKYMNAPIALLNYDDVYDDACEYIEENEPTLPISWLKMAKAMGYKTKVTQADLDVLKNAIEDAIADYS